MTNLLDIIFYDFGSVLPRTRPCAIGAHIYRMAHKKSLRWARPFFRGMDDDDICIQQLIADSGNRIRQRISRCELHACNGRFYWFLRL